MPTIDSNFDFSLAAPIELPLENGQTGYLCHSRNGQWIKACAEQIIKNSYGMFEIRSAFKDRYVSHYIISKDPQSGAISFQEVLPSDVLAPEEVPMERRSDPELDGYYVHYFSSARLIPGSLSAPQILWNRLTALVTKVLIGAIEAEPV